MNIITTILLVVLGIIALLLLMALFVKKTHYVRRSVVINAPKQEVFAFLRLIKNQDRFNKWAKTDADRKETTRGTDGTVGYIYAWTGNSKAGAGEKEITKIIEGERIETEIRFTKPMKVAASVIMETESLSDNQTKVSMTNTGTLPYPLNGMIPIAEKNFAKDLDSSLRALKQLLEEEGSTIAGF